MVATEELLACDGCGTRKDQPVREDLLPYSYSPQGIRVYCPVCCRITNWHYPTHICDRREESLFAPDPLLETGFAKKAEREPLIAPDPLLVRGYESEKIVKEKHPEVRWDWFG